MRFFASLWCSAAVPTPRRARYARPATAGAFPERKAPQVADLLDPEDVRAPAGFVREGVHAGESRCSRCPCTTHWHWYKGPDKEIDPFEENRQKQVVGLIRTNFLKRFESSVVAFELSCDRLLKKLLAFVEIH